MPTSFSNNFSSNHTIGLAIVPQTMGSSSCRLATKGIRDCVNNHYVNIAIHKRVQAHLAQKSGIATTRSTTPRPRPHNGSVCRH
ncbi:unnamed protein product [Protopolystoma xenopodis]|uniref:Uncharacterized protein n=1 Tax=Protopolystoma xenopodis TaxID=117903 RepID=A0A448XC76_9PLAT|nr:unnamed protein product [Protopolystoma xenopodis]